MQVSGDRIVTIKMRAFEAWRVSEELTRLSEEGGGVIELGTLGGGGKMDSMPLRAEGLEAMLLAFRQYLAAGGRPRV